jgi:hypothetical protein
MEPETTSPPSPASSRADKPTIRFTLAGLVILVTSLVTVTALVTHQLKGPLSPDSRHPAASGGLNAAEAPATPATPATPASHPWGDLATLDIEIEQPEEYVSLESTTVPPTAWAFGGTTRTQARTLMTQCGFTAAQVEQAFAQVEDTASATVVRPTPELVLSLTPEVRSKFYTLVDQYG